MHDLVKLARNQWDRTIAIGLVTAGLVALLAGWMAVGDTVFTFEQIPYLISGGLIGVCLVALGATLWISADLRDEWRKLDRLEEAMAPQRSVRFSEEIEALPVRTNATRADAGLRLSER